jgi:hypothetical protein
MPITIADITLDDPARSWRDQLYDVYKHHDSSSAEYTTAHHWLYAAEAEGRLPTHAAETVRFPLQDGREVLVRKHRAAEAHAPGRVEIAKRYGSAGEEVEACVQEVRQASPALSLDAAYAAVFKEDRALYDRYVIAQRKGEAHAPLVTKAAPLSYEAVMQ